MLPIEQMGNMMKPDYSIQALADLRGDSVQMTVESLMAYGVTAYHRGNTFDLSRLERTSHVRNGDSIYVFLGGNRYEPPDTSDIIVLSDSLPAAWVRCISDGLSDENKVASTLSPNGPPSSTLPTPLLPPTSPDKPVFSPKVGWQIALFDAWPDICKAYSRIPTAREASNWLKRNDTSGYILNKGTGSGLWWKPQRSDPREVPLKTIENVISVWRVNGDLPA